MTTELMNNLRGLVKQLNLQQLIELDNTVRRALKMEHNWFNTERPSWDAYGSFIAYAVSLRGSCVRRRAGAVIMDKEHSILSTGYNGKGAKLTNCADDLCKGAVATSGTALSDCEAIHAELNAVMRCKDRNEIHTVYVTCSPCVSCVDMLLGTSCQRVVFSEEYPHNEESKRRWEKAGREWVHYQGPKNWAEINETPEYFPSILPEHDITNISFKDEVKGELVWRGGCCTAAGELTKIVPDEKDQQN